MMENRAVSANLGDFLRIKEDDINNHHHHHQNGRRSTSHSNYNNNGDRLAGLTLGGVLSGEIGPTPSTVQPVQPNRTLLDIIRDEPFVKNARDEKKSWNVLKHKLKWRSGSGAGAGAGSRGYLVQNEQHSNRFIPPSNSNPAGTESEAPTSLASLMMRSSSAVMLNERSGGEEIEERREGGGGSGGADDGVGGEEEQPVRMSLMALLEVTDRQVVGVDGSAALMAEEDNDEEEDEEEEEEEVFMDVAESAVAAAEEEEEEMVDVVVEYNKCCVCMVRVKGAAFIPCGHTFCRVCSRELWVQRGNCPLCNNLILEILDLF